MLYQPDIERGDELEDLTVQRDSVTVRKIPERKSEGIVVKYLLDSSSDVPTAIEFTDELPSTRSEVGFPADREPESWETEDETIAVEHTLNSRETSVLALGIVLGDEEATEFDISKKPDVRSVQHFEVDSEKSKIEGSGRNGNGNGGGGLFSGPGRLSSIRTNQSDPTRTKPGHPSRTTRRKTTKAIRTRRTDAKTRRTTATNRQILPIQPTRPNRRPRPTTGRQVGWNSTFATTSGGTAKPVPTAKRRTDPRPSRRTRTVVTRRKRGMLRTRSKITTIPVRFSTTTERSTGPPYRIRRSYRTTNPPKRTERPDQNRKSSRKGAPRTSTSRTRTDDRATISRTPMKRSNRARMVDQVRIPTRQITGARRSRTAIPKRPTKRPSQSQTGSRATIPRKRLNWNQTDDRAMVPRESTKRSSRGR